MDQNRGKLTNTGNEQVYAVARARQWLESAGGDSRPAAAIEVLLAATNTALERGEPPPWKNSGDLASGADAMGHSAEDSRLRGSYLDRWWDARRNQIHENLREAGCQWVPRLVVERGGGRAKPTRFSIALDPLSPEPDDGREQMVEPTASQSSGVTYRIDPAEPAYWFRLIIGRTPFPVRSLRGYILVATVIGDALLIGGMWVVVLQQWSSVRQILAIDLAMAALASILTWALLALSRPIRLLARRRVSIANDALLSTSTFHGQLRVQRDPKRKLGGRTFSFVRHWGNCPICAAEVDLDDGGRAFPDRIIGRCNDAPFEHVFSFDPVTLTGYWLYEANQEGSQRKHLVDS